MFINISSLVHIPARGCMVKTGEDTASNKQKWQIDVRPARAANKWSGGYCLLRDEELKYKIILQNFDRKIDKWTLFRTG
jgi:hypothetical protein